MFSELETKLAKAQPRFDYPKMVKTSLGTATNIPPVLIIRPTLAARQSSLSTPVVGTSKASTDHEIEEDLEHMDPWVWETFQEVFEKNLLVEKLEEL